MPSFHRWFTSRCQLVCRVFNEFWKAYFFLDLSFSKFQGPYYQPAIMAPGQIQPQNVWVAVSQITGFIWGFKKKNAKAFGSREKLQNQSSKQSQDQTKCFPFLKSRLARNGIFPVITSLSGNTGMMLHVEVYIDWGEMHAYNQRKGGSYDFLGGISSMSKITALPGSKRPSK